LPKLVPTEAVPRRRMALVAEVRALAARGTGEPMVLKVPSDLPNGGGHAVALCRTHDELRLALERFAGVEEMVLEEYLSIEKSFCLNYCTHEGRVHYLGGAEQVVDAA